MVERLQEPLRGATFVDLDGTLLSANSMRIFAKRLPGLLMKRGGKASAIGCLWRIVLRKMRLISHRSMKWHLTKAARLHLQEEDWELLAEVMTESINPAVAGYIETRRSKGCLTFIATAALEEYTLPLSRLLGYDGVLATKFADNESEYEELKRHAKQEAIAGFLQEHNLRLESFLTDHTDDLPTAKAYPLLTIIVNATTKTSEAFREAGITRYIS